MLHPDSPVADELRALLLRSATLAGDTTRPEHQREQAAVLCGTLAREVGGDLTGLAGVLRAAGTALDSPPTLLGLLSAASALAVDESSLLVPLRHLAERAFACRQAASATVVLVYLSRLQVFDGQVPTEWFPVGRELDANTASLLRRLVVDWVGRFGGSNKGVLALIQEHQEQWFLTLRRQQQLSLADLLAHHAAQPTPAGWIALARRRAELPRDPLPLSFGGRQGEALTTIREALWRHLDPLDVVLLDRWFAALLLQ